MKKAGIDGTRPDGALKLLYDEYKEHSEFAMAGLIDYREGM